MMQQIKSVLTSEAVLALREQLAQASWIDGRTTTGSAGAQVKANQQVDTSSTIYPQLKQQILDRLNSHPEFFSITLPVNLSDPLFNRYSDGGHYGFHVDGSVRHQAGGWMRTDISATLFLSDPESYAGGELVIQDTYGQQQVKLPAGDLILYPSSSLHCVMPVTRGERVACFMWIQSMIRNDQQRAMLLTLDRDIQQLQQQGCDTAICNNLLNLYHNLLRDWSEL